MTPATVTALLALASTAVAQLPLTLNSTFVDPNSGGSGNIGVAQEQTGLGYYLVDFNDTQSVHLFDSFGNARGSFATPCTPALPSPNDIAFDPVSSTLWLVDNSGGVVVNLDLAGNCLGGFAMAPAPRNPVGICFNVLTQTLFVSHDGGVAQFDTLGNPLPGGFALTPVTGSTILSGIAHVPATNRFLITQSGGRAILEVDAFGNLLSTTDLTTFGVTNLQGICRSLATDQISVVDNSQSTVYVFDTAICSGAMTALGQGCADAGATTLQLAWSGCPDLGQVLRLRAGGSIDGLPFLFIGGLSDTVGAGLPLPVDLAVFGGPAGCLVYTSTDAILTTPSAGGTAVLPLSIPTSPGLAGVQTFWQALKIDPALPQALRLATTNYLRMIVQ